VLYTSQVRLFLFFSLSLVSLISLHLTIVIIIDRQVDCSYCLKITDEGLIRLVSSCPSLEALAIEGCTTLTDAAFTAIAQHSSRLKVLKAAYQQLLTDAGLGCLGRCKSLEMLDMSYSPRTTIAGIAALLAGATKLSNLQARGLCATPPVPPASVFSSSGTLLLCPAMRTINIAWSRDLDVDTVAVAFAKSCPSLESVNVSRCPKLTDEAVRQLAGRCPNIRQLNLTGCPLVQPATIRFLVLSGVGVST